MSTLSFESMLNTIREFEEKQPQYNNKVIDDMTDNGYKISELVMIHSMPELRDTHKLKTKHGYIDLLFNRNLTYGTVYIMEKMPKEWGDSVT